MELLVWTIVVPLALGVIIGAALQSGRVAKLSALLVFAAVAVSYIGLEGMPRLSPVSSKHKLFYLFLLAAILTSLPFVTGGYCRIATGLLILGAIGWLGFNKYAHGAAPWGDLHLLAPALAGAIAVGAAPKAGDGFERGLGALTYAIGAAILSAIGLFVGFTQVSGAMAALAGGMLIALYVSAVILSKRPPAADGGWGMFILAVVLVSLVIGMLAPEIDKLAFAILSLCLALSAVAPGFSGLPRGLRPVAQGGFLAAPAVIAAALAAF